MSRSWPSYRGCKPFAKCGTTNRIGMTSIGTCRCSLCRCSLRLPASAVLFFVGNTQSDIGLSDCPTLGPSDRRTVRPSDSRLHHQLYHLSCLERHPHPRACHPPLYIDSRWFVHQMFIQHLGTLGHPGCRHRDIRAVDKRSLGR
jgi:hypothetical protein